MHEELHSMRLFSIIADNLISPHANRRCRLSTLTRMLNRIHLLCLKQDLALKAIFTERKGLQRVSWASHPQIKTAHNSCGPERARVGRQPCEELAQTAVAPIDTRMSSTYLVECASFLEYYPLHTYVLTKDTLCT